MVHWSIKDLLMLFQVVTTNGSTDWVILLRTVSAPLVRPRGNSNTYDFTMGNNDNCQIRRGCRAGPQ